MSAILPSEYTFLLDEDRSKKQDDGSGAGPSGYRPVSEPSMPKPSSSRGVSIISCYFDKANALMSMPYTRRCHVTGKTSFQCGICTSHRRGRGERPGKIDENSTIRFTYISLLTNIMHAGKASFFGSQAAGYT